MRRVEIIGRIGKDAVLKSTTSGDSVANFSVAADGSRKDNETIWHSVAIFGKRAEKLTQYLTKGSRVFVRGEYKIRKWESNGKSGVDVDVTADEVELLGDGRKSDDERAPDSEYRSPAPF